MYLAHAHSNFTHAQFGASCYRVCRCKEENCSKASEILVNPGLSFINSTMEEQSEDVSPISSDEDSQWMDSQPDEYIELVDGSPVKLWKSARFRLVEVSW